MEKIETFSGNDGKHILNLSLVTGSHKSDDPRIFLISFLQNDTPDNRLTPSFLSAFLSALTKVQATWEGLESTEKQKGAALITSGGVDSKFYSNGLDLNLVFETPDFFDKYINRVYEKLLTFPIPTIASVGGHCFAGAFGLAMCHDYRVFNGARGYMCMNEIDFGAQIFPGLHAALWSKIKSPFVFRKIILEGYRFSGAEALNLHIVDALAPEKGQQGGAKQTLEKSIEIANAVAPKAAADGYGPNKIILYSSEIATLRTRNEEAKAKL